MEKNALDKFSFSHWKVCTKLSKLKYIEQSILIIMIGWLKDIISANCIKLKYETQRVKKHLLNKAGNWEVIHTCRVMFYAYCSWIHFVYSVEYCMNVKALMFLKFWLLCLRILLSYVSPSILTRNNRKIFATIMETTLNEAPMTPATGLCGTNIGGFPFSHLYSDMS